LTQHAEVYLFDCAQTVCVARAGVPAPAALPRFPAARETAG
jgi:hypothetical protein